MRTSTNPGIVVGAADLSAGRAEGEDEDEGGDVTRMDGAGGAEATIPEGFSVSERTGPFVDLLGPLYTASTDEGVVLGLPVDQRHLNTRRAVHGAVLTALLDLVMGRNAAGTSGTPAAIVTASLTVDFVASAGEGDWLEARAQVSKRGRRICFATGSVHSGERLVATASGVFATTGGG